MDLLDDRWVPVMYTDGGQGLLGLRGVFERAGRIARVRSGSVLEDRAIERLLVAVCLRAGGPDRVPDYLRAHRPLFDADRFCQHDAWPGSARPALGMDRLVLDPAGPVPPARLGLGDAVRAMLARMLFDPAGIRTGLLGDPMSSSGRSMPIGPALLAAVPTVIVHPGTLSGMLAWNTPAGGWQADWDVPVWEDDPARPRGAYTADQVGAGRLLVWPGRRLRLYTTDDETAGPVVTGCLLANGDKLDFSSVTGTAADPHGLWERTRSGKTVTRQDRGCPWDALVDRGGPAPVGLARLLDASGTEGLPERVTVSQVAVRLDPGHGVSVVDVDDRDLDVDPRSFAGRRAALPALEDLVETIAWANATLHGALTRKRRADLAGWETIERRRIYEALAPTVTDWIAGHDWDQHALDQVIAGETTQIERHLTRRFPDDTNPARLAGAIRRRARELADKVTAPAVT